MRTPTNRSWTGRAGALVAAATLLLAAACSETDSGYNEQQPRFAPGGGAVPAEAAAAGDFAAPGGYEIPPEVSTREQTSSTFAIDVDTASYAYARRLIVDGEVPRTGIRPEEFINAFGQDYPQPAGDGFAVAVDGARTPAQYEGDGEYYLLRVGLRTRDADIESRPDVALTFVIDVSGSMREPGRLDLVQDALDTLIDQLRPNDRVAIVAYNDRARVLREMTPASDRRALHGAVGDLSARGSTNLEQGLVTGYRVAREGFVPGASNRVILLSDGLANVGNTEADPILSQIREEAGKQIALLGVGVGSEYGDELMERLADEGDGFVTYVSERQQARELFVERLPATLVVRALDAKVQVEFDARIVRSYRLVGYDNRALDPEDFRNDRVDGGEVGPGHSVTALYVVRLQDDAPNGEVATVRVRWLEPTTRQASETAASAYVADLDRPFATTSPRLRTDYAAGFFAEVLRESPYGRLVRLADLATVAEGAAEATGDEQVAELASLIRLVQARAER